MHRYCAQVAELKEIMSLADLYFTRTSNVRQEVFEEAIQYSFFKEEATVCNINV